MNNPSSLEYLNSLRKYGIVLGLKKIKTILQEFDNPQNSFQSIIVGGTNGKGSVSAMIAEALKRHNFKVGLYTSPHLIDVNERIRINDECISASDLEYLLFTIKKKINSLLLRGVINSPPTFFETLTICAFLYFARQKVDISILEVGMGGRLDATNVVNPVISIITNISKDHMNFLGNTIKEIAMEKAGIIKNRIPLVCGCKSTLANQIIKQKALTEKAPIFNVYENIKNFKYEKENLNYKVEVEINNYNYRFRPALLGYHQIENALIALLTLEKLNQFWKPLNRKKFIKALENVNWPCRLELFRKNSNIFLDGAHNTEGIKAIKHFIEEFNIRPINLIFAIMRDKEIKKITNIIFPLAKNIILTKFPFYRAAEPEGILEISSSFKDKIAIEPNPLIAFQKAEALSNPSDNILITGSLYLAGEIKKFLNSSA